jgi:predicted PurR-regulated permease PerM
MANTNTTASALSTRLAGLPWEKWLIWALFLGLVYILRELFLIIFLTFLLTYFLRSAVVRLLGWFSPTRLRPWLERSLAVLCWCLLIGSLYLVGAWLGPRLVQQAESMVGRITRINPVTELDDFLTRSIGAYLFERDYGTAGDQRYERALADYRKHGLQVHAHADFPALQAAIEGPFIAAQLAAERRRIADELGTGGAVDRDFREWFLRTRAPELFAKHREARIREFEQHYADFARTMGLRPLAELAREPDYQLKRDQQILEQIYDRAYQNAAERSLRQNEWTELCLEQLATDLKDATTLESRPGFAQYYADRRRTDPGTVPYTFDGYLRLEAAYNQGSEAFAEALAKVQPVGNPLREHLEFRHSTQRTLARRWATGPLAVELREMLTGYFESVAKTAAAWLRKELGFLLSLPAQVSLALVLALFITFDVPRLRRAFFRLEQTRLRHFYREIAPSLVSFGQLIGRAFQAQFIIALANAPFTYLAIHFLGVQNDLLLTAIVFVFGFIPIVGVFVSTVPIALVALLQPDGGFGLAAQVIVAIIVIHFLETSFLNPKILGDMLNLHPVLVLAVLAIGEHFFGIWGLLLAVPVTVYVVRHVILDQEVPPLDPAATGLGDWPEGGPPAVA